MRSVASNVLTILVAVGIAIAIAIGYGKSLVDRPGPLTEEIVVQVERGASLDEISEMLEAEGAIKDARQFRLAARYSGAAQSLKFGEYAIPPRASVNDIVAKLSEGDTISYRVTVAEGLSSWEVVQILEETDVLTGVIEDVPAEGSLAPDTYFVSRGDRRGDVIARMQERQRRILAAAWEGRDASIAVETPEEALILASIVEKETGVAEERPQVASVFDNRLRIGMRLQSDPTVIYGITNGEGALGRGIRRSELDARTPYNTYQIDGLPPTPIANPGREAIMAVMNPAETPYYYFVADGTGGHAFAETLEEHNRNVARWREIERTRSQN
jgi:UPF0755 protein